MVILSESAGDSGSVQRLTAQAERRRLGTVHTVNTVGHMRTNLTKEKKYCVDCLKGYKPSSNRQKRCVACQSKEKARLLKEYHQKTYVKKGYNQFRENNNNWKGGIGVFTQIKQKVTCETCGSTENLCIHHVDRNRYNNAEGNLKCLCKRCHQIEHKCWDNFIKKSRCKV